MSGIAAASTAGKNIGQTAAYIDQTAGTADIATGVAGSVDIEADTAGTGIADNRAAKHIGQAAGTAAAGASGMSAAETVDSAGSEGCKADLDIAATAQFQLSKTAAAMPAAQTEPALARSMSDKPIAVCIEIEIPPDLSGSETKYDDGMQRNPPDGQIAEFPATSALFVLWRATHDTPNAADVAAAVTHWILRARPTAKSALQNGYRHS